MIKIKQLFASRVFVIVLAAVLVLLIAAGVGCAVALSGKAEPVLGGSEVSADACSDTGSSLDSDDESVLAQSSEETPDIGNDAELGETMESAENAAVIDSDETVTDSEESRYYATPEPIPYARYAGVYPNGVPVLSEEQIKAITPDMTWREILAGFGLGKTLQGGMALGVENNRLLLLDYSDVNAACGCSGAELLTKCVEMWRPDLSDGSKFVTFSNAVGIIIYDDETNQICFGEWSFPSAGGSVSYNIETGETDFSMGLDEAPFVFDKNGDPVQNVKIGSGVQGYAVFSDPSDTVRPIDRQAFGTGFAGHIRIGKIILINN